MTNLPQKRYYTIGEVAKKFNVNTSLLRFWEKEFQEIQPKKKESGTRKFSQQDIEVIRIIYHLLKEKKMTIEGTKKHLKTSKNREQLKLTILSKLEKVKSELEHLKNNL